MGVTRRAFLGLGAATAASCALGGVAWASAGAQSDLLRPPVVDDEVDFAARCIRCYRCIEACHTRALRPADISAGLAAWSMPVFDFHKGACDFCNACVEACPVRALRVADPDHPETGRIGTAQVQPDRCIAFEHGCEVCVEACPYGAISKGAGGVPQVDDARCNGCGVCENVCPALVYRSFSGGSRRGIVVVSDASTGEGVAHA